VVSEKVAGLRKKLENLRARPTVSATEKLERRTPGRTLWWWLSFVVVTASGGFIAPAIAMAFSVTEGWDGGGQFAILTLAGVFQGFVLGVGEVIALRRGPLRVPTGRWIFATTLGMGLSWVVALLPGSFGRPDWSNPAVLVGIVVAVLAVILIVPFFQWLILRSRVADAWRWILVMCISISLGVGALLLGIVFAAGKTTFIGTLAPFVLTGWVGVILFTVVSGLGVYWMAREAYTAAETAAALARRAANEGNATAATKRAVARVRATATPAVKKAASKVTAVAKKAGSKSLAAAKKAGSKTSVAAKKAVTRVRAQTTTPTPKPRAQSDTPAKKAAKGVGTRTAAASTKARANKRPKS
jgi:MFS family permease